MVLRGLLDAEKSPARFSRYPGGIRQTHSRARFHPVHPGRISTGLVTSTRDCDDFDRGGRPLFLLDCSRRYAVDRSHANRDDAGLAGTIFVDIHPTYFRLYKPAEPRRSTWELL